MKKIILIFCLIQYNNAFCGDLETGIFPSSVKMYPHNITLVVYTKVNQTGTEIALSNAHNITEVSQFNKSLDTLIHVYGWKGTVDNDFVIVIREALLSSANVNVIIVNWTSCAKNENYIISQSCVADVGKYVGEFVETMCEAYNYSKSNIIVTGHSLGAHIAGYIGKRNNGSLGCIIGLDPAKPLFYEDCPSTRLYIGDALFVQTIHTDIFIFGVHYEIGHVNFWPNGGSQPGCGLDRKCSHMRANCLFAESIRNITFYSRQCDSYFSFKRGYCSGESVALMGGINIDTSINGNYYLDTNDKPPYGQGNVV